MNRETKRMMQRQGEVGPDGAPLPTPRTSRQRTLSSRPATAKRGTPFGYLRDVKTELKKVAWPTRLEVRNYSTVVLITLAFMITFIFVLDYAFSQAAVFLFK